MDLKEYNQKTLEIGDTVVFSVFKNDDPKNLDITDFNCRIGVIKYINQEKFDTIILSQDTGKMVQRHYSEIAIAPPEALLLNSAD